MIYFVKRDSKGVITTSNVSNERLLEGKKSKEFTTNSGTLSLFSDDHDLIKSSKIFKKLGLLCAQAFEIMYRNFTDQIKAHSHTLKKIQGQLNQRIEGVIGSSMYSLAQDYKHQKEAVLKKIREEPESVADSLIYIDKRIFELGAHMSSFEILHMGEQLALDMKTHNLQKLLTNILHAFENSIEDLSIKPRFMFDNTIEQVVEADYKTLNAAFYNFFDNTIKYAKPYSEIRFYLDNSDVNKKLKLIITMRSLRIDQDELKKIFELGYRGRHCTNNEGTGVGMYIVGKALKINGLVMEVVPNYSDMERHDGQQYIMNKFIISQL